MWSDTDEGYPFARVIFVDTEESNWTYDPVRRQFFWHRFFSHQPDLNYENPAVQQDMLNVIRFWLDLGIDGFRLDAVPYLFEAEGTNCENLPRDARVPPAAAQGRSTTSTRAGCCWPRRTSGRPTWSRTSATIETGGDECHMAFHFPLMPALLHGCPAGVAVPDLGDPGAARRRSRPSCQWGIFLRNHDELTLEMVTDEERDYMYSEYAKDPRMRANVGIRRRLASLLENDRNQIELFTAMLLSLPGSPVLYYGDEIGMGDNIWLGDRDGVRTPMQWTPDRNAGFSAATPGRLFLPVNQDPIYGYQALNVEAQRDNPASILHWTRTMLAVRRRHEAFALGDFEELDGSNPSVLAYLRRTETIVVLSRQQPVPLPAADRAEPVRSWAGYTPIELTGRVPFPMIGQLPYLLTLPGHAFYWLQLRSPEENR